MFNYPGSKYFHAKRYPAPFYDTIIEPFAGSAQYSVLHGANRRVILVDLRKDTCDLWKTLQRATPEEILALPTFVDHEEVIHENESYKYLMLLALSRGDKLNYRYAGTGEWLKSWPAKRKKIALGLEGVRHFEIINGNYLDAPDVRATWFIDPPYEYGTKYGCPRINYSELSDWVLSRRGQVIVCEQAGAEWLPFKELHKPDQSNGYNYCMGRSIEVVFHRHTYRRGVGDVPPTYGHGRYW